MAIQERINQTIATFANRVKTTNVSHVQWLSISEARDKKKLRSFEWAQSVGIYLFVQDDQLKYVGRALSSTGLLRRVHEQANARGDKKWDDVIQPDATVVGVLPLTGQDEIWAASLEVHLIESFKPTFNMRR
jgi:excinuclease UvrABC nuclease subunit